MNDHYNWSFPQRNETMFMATMQNSLHEHRSIRQSSFQKADIPGAQPKRLIPVSVHRDNFSNSAYIEPVPESHIIRNKYIETNNLKTRDIEKAYPQHNGFQTSRMTNPLTPTYKLPFVTPVDPQPPRQFLRNTLDISDIPIKQKKTAASAAEKPPIQGSTPRKLFKTINAVNRLDVKDINKDGVLIRGRKSNPSNPLDPSYTWRDQRTLVNQRYGDIGNHQSTIIPQKVNRRDDLSLGIYDIEGAKANSSNQRRYFFSKRRQYRDINGLSDLNKIHASSLKKGITTNRKLNPLMPQYKYPQP